MIKEMRDHIVSLLQTTSLGDSVYKFPVEDPETAKGVAYPHAYVVFVGSTAGVDTNDSVERVFEYKVRIQHEASSHLSTSLEVDDRLLDLADEVQQKVDNDRCGQTGVSIQVVGSSAVGASNAITGVRYIEITVHVTQYINLL